MRIRVGYASPDYRVHPAGFLTRNLFRMHDRARFEVFGYGLAPSDDSRIANELRAGFDAFRDVSFLDNAAIAQRIADDGIDILVDLAGYTNFSRSEAFALRPAPLNVNWLGYPGTLGARYMDYAVTDGIACPPGAEAHWSEKLVRLPHTYFVTDADPVRDARMPTRAEMGLPDKGFVFCCFNNAWKLDPRMFSGCSLSIPPSSSTSGARRQPAASTRSAWCSPSTCRTSATCCATGWPICSRIRSATTRIPRPSMPCVKPRPS
jgi:predicted O-linked N-acetylglucosamine transferase (SPINDLY family)